MQRLSHSSACLVVMLVKPHLSPLIPYALFTQKSRWEAVYWQTSALPPLLLRTTVMLPPPPPAPTHTPLPTQVSSHAVQCQPTATHEAHEAHGGCRNHTSVPMARSTTMIVSPARPVTCCTPAFCCCRRCRAKAAAFPCLLAACCPCTPLCCTVCCPTPLDAAAAGPILGGAQGEGVLVRGCKSLIVQALSQQHRCMLFAKRWNASASHWLARNVSIVLAR